MSSGYSAMSDKMLQFTMKEAREDAEKAFRKGLMFLYDMHHKTFDEAFKEYCRRKRQGEG